MTDKFTLLAELASDWWWEMDAELRLTFLSERFTDVFGLPAGNFIGKLRTEIPRTDYDSPSWKAHLDDLRHRRPFRDFETTMIDTRGVSRPIALSGTPLFGATGEFEGYLGIGRDLTELRTREREVIAHARNLEAIIQHIDQAVVLLDAEFNLVAYNRRLVEFLEFDPLRDLHGKSYEALVRELALRGEYAPEPLEASISRRLDVARSNVPFALERKRADGRTVSASYSPIPGGGGVITYTDVTDARRREEKLAESEERFRHLFAHSPLSKWVYHRDTLRFLEVNDAAVAIYGYSREEFLTMTLRDVRPPDEVEKLEKWLATPPELRPAPEFRHRTKNGRIVDVEVFLRDLPFDGQPGRLAVILDVTARKDAERRVQRIFETSREVILVTNGYGKVLQVSPRTQETLGYAPEDMIGRSTADFIFPEDLEPTRYEMRAARDGNLTTNFSCRYRHKDGRVIPLVWTGVWSEPDHWHIFMGRDMSDYERAHAQLRQAQKMEAVGQLTGGIAHDFNNILMVILAGAESLEEEETLPSALRADVAAIRGAAERAAGLTRQLLAFSRKQSLRPQSTNINELVATTGKLLDRTLGEDIQMDSVLGEELAAVDVDRAQLEAALVNLCINARDAMPEGGHLLLETANVALDEDYVAGHPDLAAGDYVMVAVTDTGSGMPADVLDRVFEPFFTTKPTGKGTGLGLSMVYGFVKQSRGHIRIYSEPGQGTTVKIFLPSAPGTGQPCRPAEVGVPRGHEYMLVVEDDPNVRRSIVQHAKSLGYDVAEASNAAEGLAALRDASRRFDLLLTDVVMPGAMNGPSFAKEASRHFPGLKIVFMSGYTDKAITRQCRLEAGARVLNKPFRKHELAQMLRTALDG